MTYIYVDEMGVFVRAQKCRCHLIYCNMGNTFEVALVLASLIDDDHDSFVEKSALKRVIHRRC